MLKLLQNSAIFAILLVSFEAYAITAKEALMKRESQIFETAKEYEAFMISNMLKASNQFSKVDPVFGGGQAESIYKDMLLDEYTNEIARQKSFGIAESLAKSMQKNDTEYNILKAAVNDLGE